MIVLVIVIILCL